MTNNKKSTEEHVFGAIDDELKYMQEKFGEGYLYRNTHQEWLIAMKDYTMSALLDSLSGNPEKSLDTVRKIVAMGITMLEYKGCPERTKK